MYVNGNSWIWGISLVCSESVEPIMKSCYMHLQMVVLTQTMIIVVEPVFVFL